MKFPEIICVVILVIIKRTTIQERVIADTCHAFGDIYVCEGTTTAERAVSDAYYVVGNFYAFKGSTTRERRVAYLSHVAVGDTYICK